MTEFQDDPKFLAAVKLIERTGSSEFQIRYDDEQAPVVWVAVAGYGTARGARRVRPHYECGAAFDPTTAVLRLCERLIDGGQCKHCGRPTIFVTDTDTDLLDALGCVYAWDPELATFRRGCEGDTPPPSS
jgi:hypothetical protein